MCASRPKPNRGEARAALVAAARRLFAERGYRATTRRIAAEAGVSHALLRYHFSSKADLRDAVDEDVLGSFGQAIGTAVDEGVAPGTLAEAGRAAALVFGADTERRRYVRRVLSAEDRRWAAYQVLFLILGPLLLEPALKVVLGSDPFEPSTLAERSAANQRLLQRGLFDRH